MQFRSLARRADVPHEPWFRAALLALVVGQIAAIWMLCSHQVRQAELRHEAQQIERVALSDCLQQIPQSTLRSCASRIAPQTVPEVNARDLLAESDAAARGMAAAAVPVSFTYR